MAESAPSGSSQTPQRPSTNKPNQELTGDFTKDVTLAVKVRSIFLSLPWWIEAKVFQVKRINLAEDISNIGQMPCARTSLLSGIASGVGIGFIRGITASNTHLLWFLWLD